MKKILLIFILFWLLIKPSFAEQKQSFLVSDLTTAKLWEYLNKLKEEQQDFIKNKSQLDKEYWELISFIKNDLSKNEIKEIKEYISIFLEKRNLLQQELNQKISKLLNVDQEKKDLLILRADIYKYLSRYVIKEKQESFLEHIRFQIKSEKESKDLIEEIKKSQNILDQKISYYKDKIEQHKIDLQAKIDILITEKIKQKIKDIDQDPKYDSIPKEIKNKLYNDFLFQIKDRIKEIQDSKLSENYKEIKINIFNKLIDEIYLKIK